MSKHVGYKERACLYAKDHRQNVAPELKSRQNDQARLHMQAKRVGDMAQQVPATNTRTDEERRSKWREKKKQMAILNANLKKRAWFK